MEKAGGLHKFMNWDRVLLTDSGGFQMVSLLKLAEITEEGVKFQSLNEKKGEVMLTPEHSIEVQNAIGADIIMQLDDVVKTTFPEKSRIETSVERLVLFEFVFSCIATTNHRTDTSCFLTPTMQRKLSVMKNNTKRMLFVDC